MPTYSSIVPISLFLAVVTATVQTTSCFSTALTTATALDNQIAATHPISDQYSHRGSGRYDQENCVKNLQAAGF